MDIDGYKNLVTNMQLISENEKAKQISLINPLDQDEIDSMNQIIEQVLSNCKEKEVLDKFFELISRKRQYYNYILLP